MGRLMKKIKNKQYGQAMAEFALTLPIFLLLVFGIIELSRFFLVYSSVYTASREASRYGSSVGEGGTTNYMNCAEIIQTAVRMGNFGGVQPDDVTIYYEKSPTAPEGERVACDGVYQPKLGERLVVEIESEYVSLLGIVPNIPVRSVNGRTILMNIIIERTPIPLVFDRCINHVTFVDSTPSVGDEGYILSVEIHNSSSESTFTILEIKNLEWAGTPKLMEVRWAKQDDPIWVTDVEGGRTTGFSLPTPPIEGEPDYWNLYLRNLYPDTTSELEFIFDGDNNGDLEDINLSFNVFLHHTNVFSDQCEPGN